MATNCPDGRPSPLILANCTHGRLTPEKREWVLRLKAEGWTNRKIVKETGVSLGSVSNITRLQAHGVGRIVAPQRERGFHVEPNKKRKQTKIKSTHTIAKRYKLPAAIVARLKKEAPQHGSIGRALQLATELLIRLNKPLKIEMPEGGPGAAVVGQTYKITPRTADLIDRLAKQYGTRGAVLAACARMLAAGENMKVRISESEE